MRFRILKYLPPVRKPPRPPRPWPAVTQDNAFWFEGTRAHKLLIQHCTSCGTLRHPPLPACAVCGSLEWDTVESSGHGTVYSYVVVHYPQVPSFDYPLPIGLIELEEGTRVVANLDGVEPMPSRSACPCRPRSSTTTRSCPCPCSCRRGRREPDGFQTDRRAARGVRGRHGDLLRPRPRRKDRRRRAGTERFDRDLWKALAEADLLGIAIPEGTRAPATASGLCLYWKSRATRWRRSAVVHRCWARSLSPISARRPTRRGCPAGRRRGDPHGSPTGAATARRSGPGWEPQPRATAGLLTGPSRPCPVRTWPTGVLSARIEDGRPAAHPLDPEVPRSRATGHHHRSRDPPAPELRRRTGRRTTSSSARSGAARPSTSRGWAPPALCALQLGVRGGIDPGRGLPQHRLQFGRPLTRSRPPAARRRRLHRHRGHAGHMGERHAVRPRPRRGPRRSRGQVVGSERGQRAVHATQHLHGGMGADISYPIHRYFLWGKQIELLLGGPSVSWRNWGRTSPSRRWPGLRRRRRSVPTSASALDLSGPTFSSVAVGDELPTLVLPITRTLIVSGAIASRDYQDVHHDLVLAKERGSQDIFMNILTTNGLVALLRHRLAGAPAVACRRSTSGWARRTIPTAP